MLIKFMSLFMVLALMTTFCLRSTFAQSTPPTTSELSPPVESTTPITTRNEGQSSERLKAGVATLLNEAKAGKIAPAAKSQIQPAKSNNLSKKKAVLIAVAVVAALVITAIAIECRAGCLK